MLNESRVSQLVRTGSENYLRNAVLKDEARGGVCASAPLRIGILEISPPVFQAPMAGYTNFAFRELIRSFGGVGLVCTEMVHARGLLEQVDRGRGVPERLWGIPQEPRPLAVQLWDSDSGALASAAKWLIEKLNVSLIDLNFGCPSRQVTLRSGGGAILLREPRRIEQMVRRVVEACRPTPVSAKIRLGWNRQQITAPEVAQACEAGGAAAVTVHGRTADQGMGGRADWSRIAAIRRSVRNIVLIGNGDLLTAFDAVAALEKYPVDAVMIGRAALTRPWIFRQIGALLSGQALEPDPPASKQREILLQYFQKLLQVMELGSALVTMQRATCRFVLGRPGARAFRLAVSLARSVEELVEIIETQFPKDE